MWRYVKKLVTRAGNARARLRHHGVRLLTAPGAWSIGLDDAAAIVTELDRFRQRGMVRVLEFGSGFSTLILLSALEAKFGRSFSFVSVEADARWREDTLEKVRGAGLRAGEPFLSLHAPYVRKDGVDTFDLDSVWPQLPFRECDVILIDAPPDANGVDVRLKLCEAVIGRLDAKGVLLLHDTHRIDELYAFERLRERFRTSERLETEKGLGVFRFPR